MRIFIIGATGVLGRVLLPRLQEAGHKIHALVRFQSQAQALRNAGMVATVGEVLQEETQQQLPDMLQYLIHAGAGSSKVEFVRRLQWCVQM